ncbi:hypothetical protein RB594_005090 [Gaeumannomyces avenae]
MASPQGLEDALSTLDPRVAGVIRDANAADGVPFRARAGHLHHTWAKTFASLPELYIQPESQAEIEKVVSLARRLRRRVSLVGCGHSPSDLTCTSGWLVNLDRHARVLSLDRAAGVVVMQSGIRLFALAEELARAGLAMPNLGSINDQSVAGVISTGTHGSSLRHGLISDDVLALKITLADGKTRSCSHAEDQDLFRAALLSLGALGVITEVTFRAVPAFSLAWTQTIDSDAAMLRAWDTTLWTQAHFVRVWWFPHTRRAVVWSASEPEGKGEGEGAGGQQVVLPVSWLSSRVGYHVYHNLLWLAQYVPRVLPWVERFVFGMQFGFRDGTTTRGLQPSREALLLDCLYSQYVNEWALPLSRGPEALARLGAWLNRLRPGDQGYVEHRIPFPADGMYVHAPVEVRVSDARNESVRSGRGCRPWLDPTMPDGPTLYLNATLYRPYLQDPPSLVRYYEAFEWLMRDLGGRPHWAKNFRFADMESLYGDHLRRWREVRDRADPDGMFVGAWHRRFVLGQGEPLPLEEVEVERRAVDSNGVRVFGTVGEKR